MLRVHRRWVAEAMGLFETVWVENRNTIFLCLDRDRISSVVSNTGIFVIEQTAAVEGLGTKH